MGSSAIGTHAGMAVHMPSTPSHTFDNFARDVGDFAGTVIPSATIPQQHDNGAVDYKAPTMHSPAQDGLEFDFADRPNDEPIVGDTAAANQPAAPLNESGDVDELANLPLEDSFTDTNPISAVSAVSDMSLNPEEMKGYAQLVFPDGEYLVTSTEIMLGRDERAQQILKEQEKRIRREKREQAIRQARLHAAELDALDQYSHASAQANDDQFLEGRPAPGLPSTFSETGGIVNYEGSVDGVRKRRSKRRSFLLSHSSSTNSIAPASLHVYGAAASPWITNEDSKCIFLPIHPFQAEDIRRISKEHLRIFYDSIEKHWKMEIKGNGAFVLNELYHEQAIDAAGNLDDAMPRHFKRGDTVILTHNTEVLVTSLTFTFRLPHKRGISTFGSDNDLADESDDLSNPPDDSDDDSNQSDTDAQVKRERLHDGLQKRPKITLKATRPAVVEELAEVPAGMGSKGGKKKPKEPGSVPEQPLVVDSQQNQAPPVFDANSTLQHVPVNELPEKRKGPGRPPKNGLVSKRDEGIIRRKMKEYEKRGERPPPYKEILAAVRAENRAKELAAKAAARGEPTPANQDISDVVVNTEVDRYIDVPSQPQAVAQPHTVDSIEPADDFPADPESQESKIQQPQRTYKSPSPMKPKEEYTEEQLKRPTQTYYYILDEILSEDPEDAMELQQIYDKICKKYPFYKYVVESTGWQSSVRHNLKQNERFKPVSKQGKGWLWAIDPTVPLDKEKKKKPTPPPMSRPMHYDQNGVAQPMPYNDYMQYGQPSYPAQQANGHQLYRSPYTPVQNVAQGQQPIPNQPVYNAQSHSHPHPPNTTTQHSAVPRTVSQPSSRPASNTPQPSTGAQPGALPPAFQDLVEEIMRFRVEYLSPFGSDQAAYVRHERIFKRCVEWISQLHMRQNPDVRFENDEERRVFQILEKMRHRFETGGTTGAALRHSPAHTQPPSTSAASDINNHQLESGVTQTVEGSAPAEPLSASTQPGLIPTVSQGQANPGVRGPESGANGISHELDSADATAPRHDSLPNTTPATVSDTAPSDVPLKVEQLAADVDSTTQNSPVPTKVADVGAIDSESTTENPAEPVLPSGVKRAAEHDLEMSTTEEKRIKLDPS